MIVLKTFSERPTFEKNHFYRSKVIYRKIERERRMGIIVFG